MSDGLKESYRFCAELSRREARNFFYSFLLLPPDLRRSMCALYAFLRHTDDLADEPGPPAEKRVQLDRWRSDLDATLDGRPADWPGLQALGDAVRRHAIPRKHLHDVIDGVVMDLEPQGYATFDDLYGYCYRVASAVGLSCLHIWGYRSEGGRAEEMAEACGIALQLTNILRDVGEDARAGRIYIPREDLDRFGVDPADLAAARPGAGVRELFEFEGRRAREFYGKAAPLVRLVAPVGRPVLRAIVGIYRALLEEIARRDYDVLAGRISLPPWRKAAITLGSLAGWRDRPIDPVALGPGPGAGTSGLRARNR
jgi:phytoene synthase